jgi:4-amino-4-deoxy-L-arabinose transferase-like glycosyltransferase
MAGRRGQSAVVLFAVVLHTVIITQTLVPAQDGLKLIRVAQQFQTEPWTDVVRGSDAHPLYPALVAVTEPLVAVFTGHVPDAWRIAAQVVATLAAVGVLFPIYALTRLLFDHRIACLAAALAVVLPRAAELGHDTLSDSLGLFTTFLSLWLGAVSLRNRDWRAGVGSGLVAGVGYLARPEVILVPVAIGLAWVVGLRRDRLSRTVSQGNMVAAVVLAALAVVGSYTVIKGKVSEKLAVRFVAALGPNHAIGRRIPNPVHGGLDDPRWDFSPKEETDRIPIRNWRHAAIRIVDKWWEQLCWVFAVMTVWGLVRQRFIRGLCPERDPNDSGEIERRLLIVFAAVHALVLVYHSALFGYLSGRHVMALVYASMPWAAAGTFVCSRGIAVKRHWTPRFARCAGVCMGSLLVAASITVQMMPTHLNHLSRWGHWAAGQWLIDHARPGEQVLDTRGWARFISGQDGYDYWHVRQALSDSHLTYIVVGLDELEARSARAETLEALLSYSATPLVDFPAFPGDQTAGVRLYRFHRPGSWEGLVR